MTTSSDAIAALRPTDGRTLPKASRLTGLRMIEDRSIPEPNTGCWLWLGPVDRKGYGRISWVTYGVVTAHRYSLIERVGPIGDLFALHKCDQPSCVNPDHLFAGTAADNTADMMRKGRHRATTLKGSVVPGAKLNEQQVSEIKRLFLAGAPQFRSSALARRFGVDQCTVIDIIKGRTWRHVQ